MPIRAYVFDAYGTLFDVHAAIARHRDAIGQDSHRLSEIWRAKQLEYTWTLTLMGRYEDFWTLTGRALDFALMNYPKVDRSLKSALLNAYRELDAFPDARAALSHLKAAKFQTAILSNGSPDMLKSAVDAAALGPVLDRVLSVDTIKIYKPRREVYEMATNAMELKPREICFVSSNRWDVAGAAAVGFKAVWINRSGRPDEYMDLAAMAMLNDLNGLERLSF